MAVRSRRADTQGKKTENHILHLVGKKNDKKYPKEAYITAKQYQVEIMGERVSVFDLTEEIYLAIKDYFAGKVECGVTEIDITLYNGQKFKITIQEN